MIYMKKYALIDNQNIVRNIVLWDGETEWTPPDGLQPLDVENIKCDMGWVYDGSAFTAPEVVVVTPEPTPEPAPTPTKEELLAQLQTLSEQIQAITEG